MRTQYLPIALLVFIAIATSCQKDTAEIEPEPTEGVQFPDSHFRNLLLNTRSVDTNGDGVGDTDIDFNNDGVIQQEEVELTQSLVVDFYNREITRTVDLTGLENFVNLNFLKMSGFSIFSMKEPTEDKLITYDFTGLKQLEYLELNILTTNHYKGIDLSGLSNLKEVRLINNRPYYAEYSEEKMRLPNNFLSVNLQGTDNLTVLDISKSFVNIDFCQVPSLKKLNMSHLDGGEPAVFDFHCLTELEWLDISKNHIESLILKNSSVLNTLIAAEIGADEDAKYPYAENICIDDMPEEYEQIASLINENTVVVTDCTF